MAEKDPQFEQSDLTGSTVHIDVTASTGGVSVPTVAGNVISEFLVVNGPENPYNMLYVSTDNGSHWVPFGRLGSVSWSCKGNIRQIKIKSEVPNMKCYGFYNLEQF